MGYSGEWVAVSGIDKDEVLSRASLRETGDIEEEFIEGVSGVAIPSGWYVMFSCDDNLILDLERFSAGCRVVSAEITETAMSCITCEYRDGVKLWEMAHIGYEDIYDLNVEGTPPPEFDEIKDRLMLEQDRNGGRSADVDFIFDIPLDTADAVCGFRHDEIDVEDDGSLPVFYVLEST